MRRWIGVGAGVVAVIAGLLIAWRVFLYDPYVSAGENGVYANGCCGTIELRDGRILLNGHKSVRYVVGRDDGGAFVLPRHYVGAFPYRRFEVDGSAAVVNLRLDRLPTPGTITLYQGSAAYDFKRKAPPPPN
ncbi:hypothetical protein [Sphingomonas sp. Y38-1Y]|uniref:hypothetical protein n=1 Tax=Sphingomonas sp. Y38-1Y TaxID=3078265 RepID=UPI0028E8CCC5|nr:hypothetical protein [Sphingomonas sp. Y38-1Y]